MDAWRSYGWLLRWSVSGCNLLLEPGPFDVFLTVHHELIIY